MLRRLLRRFAGLAAERPDFVYTDQPERAGQIIGGGCSYLGALRGSEGGEGCIVGQALVRLGVEPSALEPFEGEDAMDTVLAVLGVGDWNSLSGEDRIRLSWLSDVQANQDLGMSWGMAVGRPLPKG